MMKLYRVIDHGKTFSKYSDLAKRLGHPDAVVNSKDNNVTSRYKEPQNGDVVRILAQGPHGNKSYGNVAVVQFVYEPDKKALIGMDGLKEIVGDCSYLMADAHDKLMRRGTYICTLSPEHAPQPSDVEIKAEPPKPKPDYEAQLAAIIERVEKLEAAGVLVEATEAEPTPVPAPSIELTRNDVIELAKHFVKQVERTRTHTGYVYYDPAEDTIEYDIDRDARKVTAKIRLTRQPARPGTTQGYWAHGTARTAPDDVFNVYIGKAIALARALNKDMPPEFTKAPAPDLPQKGDILTFKHSDSWHGKVLYEYSGRANGSVIVRSEMDDMVGYNNAECGGPREVASWGVIWDDTRDGFRYDLEERA